MTDEKEETIEIPEPVQPLRMFTPPTPVAPEPEVEEKDDLADLFEVPQPEDNDMRVDHLVALDEEDDLSDLTEVSSEDIMGEPYPGSPASDGESSSQPITRRVKRTGRRRYYPPPTSIGGVRY